MYQLFPVPTVEMQTCWHGKMPMRIYLREIFCYISNSTLVSNRNTRVFALNMVELIG